MKQTQYYLIIQFIKSHGFITPMDAFTYLGITKLATRISEMKKKGYIFGQEFINFTDLTGRHVSYMKYTLLKEPDAQEGK